LKVQCAHTEMVDIDLLVENPRNANKHSDKQIELLAKIMAHQGWRHPITVSKRSGFIICGHGRLAAARRNGWTKAPVDRQDFENEATEYQALISDNVIAELAEHDMQKMILDLKSLPDVDLDLLGFPDLSFLNLNPMPLDEVSKVDQPKKFVIEVEFPNDMEMMDVHDDLTSRGYLSRIK